MGQDEVYQKYKVSLRTKPGTAQEQNGFIEVFARDEKEAVYKAFEQLEQGGYSQFPRGQWDVGRVEVVGIRRRRKVE